MALGGKTSLVNIALTNLGFDPALSIDPPDDRREVKLAAARYLDVRDSLLEMLPPWNFATRRATLTATTTPAPAWGFTNGYALPEDFLYLVRMEFLTDEFRIEYLDETNKKILATDVSSPKIAYVARVSDPTDWPQLFHDAVAAKLSAELVLPLARRSELIDKFYALFAAKLDEARFQDARQAPIEVIEGSGWLRARLGADEIIPRIDVN